MASLTKICLHWTGGNSTPCKKDLDSYHFCVDSDGRIYLGTYAPEDNIDCKDGKYAKHCGGGNTGCIGIAACGMVGFNMQKKETKAPLTRAQVEAICCLAAYCSIKYNFLINENTVFTHYEFDRQQPTFKGKIDIIYLPFLPNLQIIRVGGYFRNKITWYRKKLKEGNYKLERIGNYYEFTHVN